MYPMDLYVSKYDSQYYSIMYICLMNYVVNETLDILYIEIMLYIEYISTIGII
jgi:hypothetical protein